MIAVFEFGETSLIFNLICLFLLKFHSPIE